jgi:hypothetical protein
MNPPHLAQIKNWSQDLIEGRWRLHVAEQDDGGRPVRLRGLDHMAKLPVAVTTKEDPAACRPKGFAWQPIHESLIQ